MRPRSYLALLAASAIGLAAIHFWAPSGLYSFGGHTQLLYWVMLTIVGLLFGTHTFLAVVIWAQRAKWETVDAASFLFIGTKAEFWAYSAYTLQAKRGIPLAIAYLSIVILCSTINLDIRMVRLYVLTKKSDKGISAC